MELTDSHCHLRGHEAAALSALIDDAEKCGVTRLVCIGAGEGAASTYEAVEIARQSERIWATVGIHPHDADAFTDLEQFEALVDDQKVVAIGETGLDFFRDWSDKKRQEQLFRSSIEFARRHRKPLVIHCRDAAPETLSILRELHAEDISGVFHCYAGDVQLARELADLNFLVSFPGSLTFKSAHALRETARAIPLGQMLIETDSPYMAPEPFRGKPSEPKHVYQVALKLAEIKNVSLEEVAEATTANAIRLFGLK
jgi:TatD DNase family protein